MAGFFDTFEDLSGLDWVGADEKDVLIKNSVPFEIVSITKSTGQYGERYVATVNLKGDHRAMSFPIGSVESRDRMLASMAEYLSNEEAVPPKVFLEKVGRAILIRNAEGGE